MTVQELDEIRAASAQAAAELLDTAELQPGQVLVVGCSSSEILGGQIGKYSSMDAAGAVYQGIAPVAAQRYGWEEVSVVPWPHAGGSWATTCWQNFAHPVAVEEIQAHAGMDIGGTLIGMHLRRVAVPVRLSLRQIGQAGLLCARTRPKLIGGQRAHYTEYTGEE